MKEGEEWRRRLRVGGGRGEECEGWRRKRSRRLRGRCGTVSGVGVLDEEEEEEQEGQEEKEKEECGRSMIE